MFGLLAWGIFGALAVKDEVENISCQENDKIKARESGRNYYWDSKGNNYYIKTGEPVITMIEWSAPDPRPGHEGRKCSRTKLVNKKTLKFVDWAFDNR